MQDEATRRYYEENAQATFERMRSLPPNEARFAPFLALIPAGGQILDAGCGTGRDSKYFLGLGYEVTAMDASSELCRLAGAYLERPVLHLAFQEMAFDCAFDGVWASHSLLHVPRTDLAPVLERIGWALKPGGVLYASFFYGNEELRRGGLLFNDYDEASFAAVLTGCQTLQVLSLWQTPDLPPARPGRLLFHALLRRAG